MLEFFKCLAAAGMLASLAFACWPMWFFDRHARGKPAWRITVKVLAMAGCGGWFMLFQKGIQATFQLEGSIPALILTVGILWLIYLAAGRAEALAYQQKLRLQAERNAAKRG
jgi:hypothetical protein